MPITQYATPNSPRLHVWNTQFRVYGEKQILSSSIVYLYFHALLQDTRDFKAMEADIEDSDCEEGDVDILIGRKSYKNDGDRQQLPPAHTPFYPEVCLQSMGVDIRWENHTGMCFYQIRQRIIRLSLAQS
jgi:hypothetical protein